MKLDHDELRDIYKQQFPISVAQTSPWPRIIDKTTNIHGASPCRNTYGRHSHAYIRLVDIILIGK